VAETLEGLPIVTAFNQNKFFEATASHKIDEHHRALFNAETLNLWLAFYCDLYGAILVLGVCIFAVTMRTVLGAATVGLAFSNTIQVRACCCCWRLVLGWLLCVRARHVDVAAQHSVAVEARPPDTVCSRCRPHATQMLVFYTWSVRYVADTISMMASTEKVGWLATKTPQEGDALYTADNSPAPPTSGKDIEGGKMVVAVEAAGEGGAPAGWPRQGTIEFDNVWMKYLPSAPYALKGECRLCLLPVLGCVGAFAAWTVVRHSWQLGAGVQHRHELSCCVSQPLAPLLPPLAHNRTTNRCDVPPQPRREGWCCGPHRLRQVHNAAGAVPHV
jgi:ABC-type multidrug transport system fused ATPase/permease subunit